MKYTSKYLVLTLSVLVLFNCKNDDDSHTIEDPIVLTPNVEVYDADLVENSLVLAIENGATDAYLLDKAGNKVKEWSFIFQLGNDLELLPDGKLLGMFKVDNPIFSFGGFGGIIRILNLNNTTSWAFEYASENYLAHHDVEILPNGNVLFLAWEKITAIQAQQAGVNTAVDIYPEMLIEVDPITNNIVWEWHSWDHIIQDFNAAIANFDVLSDRPERININYNLAANGDIMHANGIDHDVLNDIVYMSVNGYSEVWVIDHSTTTAQAATSNGGNYNKGGDLLYRFGNPEAYDNVGERLFYNNHFPNLLENNVPGSGHVLVFMNGTHIEQSTVYELEMPEPLNLVPNTDNEPSVAWSFTDPELYYGRISGAVRLQNGNTLICEGGYGFWEVTPEKDIAWKYNGDENTAYWRCYGYDLDAPEILSLNLDL